MGTVIALRKEVTAGCEVTESHLLLTAAGSELRSIPIRGESYAGLFFHGEDRVAIEENENVVILRLTDNSPPEACERLNAAKRAANDAHITRMLDRHTEITLRRR